MTTLEDLAVRLDVVEARQAELIAYVTKLGEAYREMLTRIQGLSAELTGLVEQLPGERRGVRKIPRSDQP